MRNHVLLKSVRRLLGPDVHVIHVATMWRRHHLAGAFAAGAFVVLFLVALFSGVEPIGSQIAIGLAGVAVAGMATTDQRVLAATDTELIMMQSSRVRHYATSVIDRLPLDTPIKVVSDNLVISDWDVGGQRFSMMKRSQRAMTAIASA